MRWSQPRGGPSSVHRLRRRHYLTALGTGVATAASGCLGETFGGPDEVVLGQQEDGRDSEHLPHPSYGDPFPTIELPDPIADTTVATDSPELEERTIVVTAFYAFCPAECLLLIRALANVQSRLLAEGIEEVSVLAITFDPERDTASKLEKHGERMGVDFDAGNWHYLRPESDEAAAAVVEDDLGIVYERDGGTDEMYEFIHQTVTFLVNPDRYVERVYHADAPDVERVSGDAERVAAADR
ncbi:SCO family protein [Natronomonas sp.]|uniref:SCO family protein n=1 Tax=Natronomonas sp. TaxID=2184060 RepID=UPI0039758767